MSAPTLVIEASTAAGSVALLSGNAVMASTDVPMGVSRDDGLLPAMMSMLADAGTAPRALGRIVCGAGPGSFTSLRIAASLAKGLAHGGVVSLHAVPSLLLAVAAHAMHGGDAGAYVAHADALREERFCVLARIDAQGIVHADGETVRVPFASLDMLAPGRRRLAVGGSPQPSMEHATVFPAAAALVHVANHQALPAVSVERWEPEYGRLAEAQVVWERTHGHALPV